MCYAISAKQDTQKKGLHILLNKPFSATVLPEKPIYRWRFSPPQPTVAIAEKNNSAG